jgi:ethanolamine-phosphate cytidylyltransferase
MIALQYVDEVIIGAPYSVTKDVLGKVYNVGLVAHGNTPTEPDLDGTDPYEVSTNSMWLLMWATGTRI